MNILLTNRDNMKDKIIIGIFFLYSISIFTSKFGISLFGGILALFSIFLFFNVRKKFFAENKTNEEKILLFFFIIFILGFIFQFFSLGGIKSSGVFFYRTYFLLIFPFTIYFLNKYRISIFLFRTMELALFIAILKSFQNFYTVYNLKYTSGIRVISFFDIMRWGIVLVIGLLIILPRLNNKFTKGNIFSYIVFFCGIISLILNNSRGPLLSFILGLLFYVVIGKKFKVLSFLILGSIIFLSLVFVYKPTFVKSFSTRVESIKETDSGSNGARIFMWKESFNFMNDSFKNNKRLFFFGTGLDSSRMKRREKIFKNYLTQKETYKMLPPHIKGAVSFMDAHNCYLNRYIETGIVYTLIYYLSLLFIVFRVFKKYMFTKNSYVLAILAATFAYAFCGIFYGYPAPYETFTLMFILSFGLVNNF